MKWNASWIASPEAPHDAADRFYRSFEIRKTVKKAEVYTTAKGVYEAFLNGSRIGDYILAPGWTVYQKRLQYQVYDVTALLRDGENRIEAVVGRGWYSSPLGWANDENKKKIVRAREKALLLELHLLYEDGEEEIIKTDESWLTEESAVRFSEIYDGETYDASFRPAEPVHCAVLPFGEEDLIPQEGELIREHEVIPAEKVFVTPEGEIMVDFGQEVTGYVEFTVNAEEGDVVRILHSEVMDREGNFYNENYRSAKAEINYICKGGLQTYHPHLTFFGFRYIKLDKWPEKAEDVRPGSFKAIAVYSDMKRTGYLKTSDSLLNRLILNAVWSQKDNFLDVPTDCPQRDERLGWTGDAAIFSKTASYTFDTRKFYKKWIHDIAADQDESGMIPHVIPNVLTNVDLESAGAPDDGGFKPTSACGWADCITMIPWNVYRTYGDVSILEDAFPVMQKYIDYIPTISKEAYLWTGTFQYGDWLGLDAEPGSYKGKSNDDFVASAFYAYTVSLFIKAGKVLEKDMSAYEALYRKIVETFRKRFPFYETQTEHVLAL
ncbi:MAG: family 78 glycoside hydrolase catalytic domain, partial [Lachnospiraceae bacterium]|nr:family 78 glycoside hydrolase catalytic domain [Lachnospiraceae bacterium]